MCTVLSASLLVCLLLTLAALITACASGSASLHSLAVVHHPFPYLYVAPHDCLHVCRTEQGRTGQGSLHAAIMITTYDEQLQVVLDFKTAQLSSMLWLAGWFHRRDFLLEGASQQGGGAGPGLWVQGTLQRIRMAARYCYRLCFCWIRYASTGCTFVEFCT